ncbi:alpha/beta hydrolase [Kribbella sandramycini]|uniref:Alpha/beta hydrolase n=1 Tax=Kribbella sandramycini TaxID=60450 RepID=A0A7Y4P102_9ACTN|nr:alpha/beta hydrolase [Kribbella sandramycini]MBB6571409.1 pimeloyl-ACP methyl ester carboxylesterase [Kribbella sandramycini]NOL43191.1 alpha/beta hydrolase [Kribbella sandramycini]
MSTPTYVLVHGAGSNSFFWTTIQRELALRGLRSYAADLPGHGLDAQYPLAYYSPQDLDAWANEPSTLASVTLQDNVDSLLPAVRRLAEHGPVVLVGASLGGVTITTLANQAPELVSHLVYISAWAPVSERNPVEYTGPEFDESLLPQLAGLSVGDPAVVGAGRANYRTADKTLLDTLKAAVLAEATDEQFRAFLNILQPDESMQVMMGDARADAATWGTIPRTYIRLTADYAMPIAAQDMLIREGDELTPDNPYAVHTMDVSHAGFIFQPEATVDILAGVDLGLE